MTHHLQRALRAFGLFWWDFLVGDTPEFAVATLAVIGLAFLLKGDRLAAAIVLPLFATASLLASTIRGRRRGAEAGAGSGSGIKPGPEDPGPPSPIA